MNDADAKGREELAMAASLRQQREQAQRVGKWASLTDRSVDLAAARDDGGDGVQDGVDTGKKKGEGALDALSTGETGLGGMGRSQSTRDEASGMFHSGPKVTRGLAGAWELHTKELVFRSWGMQVVSCYSRNQTGVESLSSSLLVSVCPSAESLTYIPGTFPVHGPSAQGVFE